MPHRPHPRSAAAGMQEVYTVVEDRTYFPKLRGNMDFGGYR